MPVSASASVSAFCCWLEEKRREEEENWREGGERMVRREAFAAVGLKEVVRMGAMEGRAGRERRRRRSAERQDEQIMVRLSEWLMRMKLFFGVDSSREVKGKKKADCNYSAAIGGTDCRSFVVARAMDREPGLCRLAELGNCRIE
jgi:hypothetical protein